MYHHNFELLLKSGIGPNFFGTKMSQQRIRFLLAHIMFDDKSTRKDRWPSDRFPAGRNIFEMFNKSCSKHVIPSEYLAIDETLHSRKHRIVFRQYNPKKPHKYGLLLKSMIHALVNEVEKDTSLKGRNISTDRLYTSVPLVKWLLDRDITTVGTLNTVRIGIPDELKDTKC